MPAIKHVIRETRNPDGSFTLKCAGHHATLAADASVGPELMQLIRARLLSGLMPDGFEVVPSEHADWLYRRQQDEAA